MNLLKTHEEILERLTELASKEKAFEERGQFRNIQKMIYEELEIIEKLKKMDVSDNIESNKKDAIDAYKLGVGKLLIGQRGSGITSTLIDECIKYDKPLLFKTPHQSNLFKKQYPMLKTYCYESTDDMRECGTKEVCVELLMYDLNRESINKELDKIRHKVTSICTVGISYHNINNEQDHFIHGNNK